MRRAPVVRVAIRTDATGELLGRVAFCELDPHSGGPGRELARFDGSVEGQVISTGSDTFGLTLYRTTLGN